MAGGRYWTEEEVALLRERALDSSIRELEALFPDRSGASIRGKLYCMDMEYKIVASPGWSEEELQILREFGPIALSPDLALMLPRRNWREISNKRALEKIPFDKRVLIDSMKQKSGPNINAYSPDYHMTLEDLDVPTRQILLGTFLGDSYVTRKPRNHHYFFANRHELKQKDYADWKKERLSLFGPIVSEGSCVAASGPMDYWGYYTRAHPMFTKLREEFYVGKQKDRIPKWVGRELGLLGLLIWFLDDGNYHVSKKNKESAKISNLVMTRENLQETCDEVNASFGGRTDLYAMKTAGIYIPTPTRNYLLSRWQRLALEIDLPKCMYYKIGL